VHQVLTHRFECWNIVGGFECIDRVAMPEWNERAGIITWLDYHPNPPYNKPGSGLQIARIPPTYIETRSLTIQLVDDGIQTTGTYQWLGGK